MINLLVVDDHIAITAGTKSILETKGDLHVDSLTPPLSDEDLLKIDFSSYEIILMDLNLGENNINGLELSKKILEAYPKCRIILYTGYDVEDYFDAAISAGLYGAINKNKSKEKILNYINHVLNDEIIVPLKVYKKKAKSEATTKTEVTEEIHLAPREKSILEALAESLTNQEIAEKLNVSKRTVEYSLTGIFNKLKVTSRIEAVLIAKSQGII